jgi:hypothetical protein
MTATALKKEIHKAIDVIDDEVFLKAVYTIISDRQHDSVTLTKSQKEVLNLRRKTAKPTDFILWSKAKR